MWASATQTKNNMQNICYIEKFYYNNYSEVVHLLCWDKTTPA